LFLLRRICHISRVCRNNKRHVDIAEHKLGVLLTIKYVHGFCTKSAVKKKTGAIWHGPRIMEGVFAPVSRRRATALDPLWRALKKLTAQRV
jgi:hypothetical protein